jgi:hypothetical protein
MAKRTTDLKNTDTMKDIANIAADAADHAMKEEQPSPKAAERSAPIPLAADGLVSDPMMVPPIVPLTLREQRRPRRGGKGKQEKLDRKAVRKAAGKVAKNPRPGDQEAPERPQGRAKTAKKSARKGARNSQSG